VGYAPIRFLFHVESLPDCLGCGVVFPDNFVGMVKGGLDSFNTLRHGLASYRLRVDCMA
jgi:hypothetical protein